MERQPKSRHVRVTEQVERLCRLYAQIGEPIPKEIIADLYRYLGAVLKAAEALDPGGLGAGCAPRPSELH